MTPKGWLCIRHDRRAHPFQTLIAAEVWAEDEARRTGRAVEVRGLWTQELVYVVDPDGRKREPAPVGRMGGTE